MKLKAIDPSGFVLKTQYDADKSGLEKKINDTDKKYLILLDFLKKKQIATQNYQNRRQNT